MNFKNYDIIIPETFCKLFLSGCFALFIGLLFTIA